MKSLDGRSIIGATNKMSLRPEFYSGRGATSSDLNSQILELIYQQVLKQGGEEEAKAFVQFIYEFPVLAATPFLNAFYSFCAMGCTYSFPEKVEKYDVGPDDSTPEDPMGSRFMTGMASIAGGMSGMADRDETEYIRGSFLRNHRTEYTPDEEREREVATKAWGRAL